MGYYFYFPPENKVIVARYGNFLERDLISQKFSGRDNDLEDDHIDTLPSENTSEILVKLESLGSPPELIPVRCTQSYGIDYEETFSPVANIRAIRILIAIAAYYDYEIWQMDVKTAFLNGRLYEDIYMEQPEGNELCASTPEDVAYMKKVPYASAVGSIMYAVRCRRPDVAFAQNLVMHGGKSDTELDVTGFCDASWQCDKDDTKSQTGYVFVVNGGAVDWKSKKQTTIAKMADTYDYLYKPCPDQPLETASEEDKAAWKAEYKKHNDVACLMLGKMSPAFQKQFESYPPQLMLVELKKIFEKPQAVEIYDLVDALHSCKQ
nr:zinc finger, CCHC-type [Tanacetum cinerariifolium]